VHSTFPNRDEALFAARQLLDKRLIACANIYEGVASLYRWEGKIQEETEVVLLAKTSKGRVSAAIAAVKALHSYELPCIIAYPAAEAFPPFLQWVEAETSV